MHESSVDSQSFSDKNVAAIVDDAGIGIARLSANERFEQVSPTFCRMLIETIGSDGGYIMDASAPLRDDVQVENIQAMTRSTREYGVYRSLSSPSRGGELASSKLEAIRKVKIKPGVCRPFEERLRRLKELTGDRELVRQVWDDLEGLAYTYIWHLLLSV